MSKEADDKRGREGNTELMEGSEHKNGGAKKGKKAGRDDNKKVK